MLLAFFWLPQLMNNKGYHSYLEPCGVLPWVHFLQSHRPKNAPPERKLGTPRSRIALWGEEEQGSVQNNFEKIIAKRTLRRRPGLFEPRCAEIMNTKEKRVAFATRFLLAPPTGLEPVTS